MTSDGHRICGMGTVFSASELREPDQPDSFSRFTATYSVTVR